jgi:hypothetical protein
MNIELTVTKRDRVTINSVKMIFDTQLMMDLQAEGTGASFLGAVGSRHNVESQVSYHVSDSYASIKATLNAASALANAVGFQREVWGVFDAGIAANKTVAAHPLLDPVTGLQIVLPIKAIITEALLLVETAFTSGTSMATISLGCAVDAVAGLKAATLVSNAAYQGTAPVKFTALIPVETAASSITPLTAARTIDATVAVEALTAGKLKVLTRYTIQP